MGEDKNSEQPKVVIRENAVEVKMPREKVVFGDIPRHIDKRGFYKPWNFFWHSNTLFIKEIIFD